MGGEDFSASSAVEAVHEKPERKIKLSPKLLFLIPVILVLLIVLKSLWPQDGGQVFLNTTRTTTITYISLYEKAPLKTPAGYNLTNLTERWAPFRWGTLLYPVNGTEMVLDKDTDTYNIYVARGTVDGWRKILASGNITVEKDISPLVYSAPYLYDRKIITFIFWWHNNTLIALNATQKTDEQIALARKMLYLYPPTEKLV